MCIRDRDDPIPPKKIAHDVERVISKMVDGVKAGKREAVNFSNPATLPKEFNFGNLDLRDALVPEAKVHLNRKRHFRIERIASPLPVAVPGESWFMVGQGIAEIFRELFISDVSQSGQGGFDAFRWTEDVDIVLRPEPRVRDVIWRLCKSLYDLSLIHI